VKVVLEKINHMSWGPYRREAVYVNSTRNLVLRQAFTLEMLSPKHRGKVLINYDESTFSEYNNTKMSWLPKG
jgi:hypothetical protein